MRNKIYNMFRKLNLDNPLEFARKLLAPLCKNKLDEHILACKDCKTAKDCKRILPKGNPDANILIIDDNATDDEEINGYTLSLLETSGLTLNDVFIINSVSCVLKRDFNSESIIRLPNRQESKNCKYFVDYAIEFVKPRYIIVLGATGHDQFKSNEYFLNISGCNREPIKGIPTAVTYSSKDIFSMLEYEEEEKINDAANEIVTTFTTAKEYIDSLERR